MATGMARLGESPPGRAGPGEAGICVAWQGIFKKGNPMKIADDILSIGEVGTISVFPAWKNAVEIAANEFSHGDVISMQWLHDNFKITKPVNGTFDDFQKYQFAFLEAIDGFKNELLENHQMAIVNIRGEGYRVLQPKEHTGYAEEKFKKDLKKCAIKAVSILTHTKFDALDDNERRQSADVKGRIAAMYAMSKRTSQLPA